MDSLHPIITDFLFNTLYLCPPTKAAHLSGPPGDSQPTPLESSQSDLPMVLLSGPLAPPSMRKRRSRRRHSSPQPDFQIAEQPAVVNNKDIFSLPVKTVAIHSGEVLNVRREMEVCTYACHAHACRCCAAWTCSAQGHSATWTRGRPPEEFCQHRRPLGWPPEWSCCVCQTRSRPPEGSLQRRRPLGQPPELFCCHRWTRGWPFELLI